ncbi:MAG: hypothetical protein GY698_24055 [Actinomycetia bacterium]|nr:hypothetical protein [Actinomycetes bacterium]
MEPVELLLTAGADVNVLGPEGETALHSICPNPEARDATPAGSLLDMLLARPGVQAGVLDGFGRSPADVYAVCDWVEGLRQLAQFDPIAVTPSAAWYATTEDSADALDYLLSIFDSAQVLEFRPAAFGQYGTLAEMAAAFGLTRVPALLELREREL